MYTCPPSCARAVHTLSCPLLPLPTYTCPWLPELVRVTSIADVARAGMQALMLRACDAARPNLCRLIATRVQVRVTSVADVVRAGMQALVLRARKVTRALPPSPFVPGVLRAFKDSRVVAEVGCFCVGSECAVSHEGGWGHLPLCAGRAMRGAGGICPSVPGVL